jgi:phosphatidylglycerophosphatase A
MKEQSNTVAQKFAVGYLSFFYTGFFPKAPGTFGSLATIPLIYLLYSLQLNLYLFLAFLIIATIITCIITESIQKSKGLHDPQWIVIDEVLGMLTTWCFIFNQFDWVTISILFALFRFFDIIKFWPASYFDKLTHGSGTILDDIVSGIYAGLSLLGVQFLLDLMK